MADGKGTDPPATDSQKSQLPPADGFQRKNRLVASISLTYLSLTILNLIIFWVAIGSNQISLISQKDVYKRQRYGCVATFGVAVDMGIVGRRPFAEGND